MRDVGLLLLGAVVGLVGSIVGANMNARLELRRERRVRIYDELLPSFSAAAETYLTSGGQESVGIVYPSLNTLERAISVLTPDERKLARRLGELLDEHSHATLFRVAGPQIREQLGSEPTRGESAVENEFRETGKRFEERIRGKLELVVTSGSGPWPSKRSLFAKPTRGFEPRTPSLRVKSGALAGCGDDWRKVAVSRENSSRRCETSALLRGSVFGVWARIGHGRNGHLGGSAPDEVEPTRP